MIYSRILATGHYLPKKILTNKELEKKVDTTDQWIIDRTGIRERHIVSGDETSTFMSTKAAEQALHTAGIKAQDIELIIVATATADKIFPSTACLVQEQLGIDPIIAFDVNAACAGFNYALSIADQYIRNGVVKTALVIGCEIMSRLIDWEDRSTCILFGDGAAGVLLQADKKPGILSTKIKADGKLKDLLFVDNPIASAEEHHKIKINMRGSEVFKIAVTKLTQLLEETLKQNQMEAKDIDWMVPHQANLRIIQAVAERIHIPDERVIVTVQEHGNTSAASVPLAFHQAVSDGRIKRGDKVLLESFGAGLAWGSALIVY